MTGPATRPIAPNAEMPPITPTNTTSVEIGARPEISIGFTMLSTVETIRPQIPRKIPYPQRPSKNSHSVAGTQTKAVPPNGSNANSAAATPNTTGEGSPAISKPTPISKPCSTAVSAVPSTTARAMPLTRRNSWSLCASSSGISARPRATVRSPSRRKKNSSTSISRVPKIELKAPREECAAERGRALQQLAGAGNEPGLQLFGRERAVRGDPVVDAPDRRIRAQIVERLDVPLRRGGLKPAQQRRDLRDELDRQREQRQKDHDRRHYGQHRGRGRRAAAKAPPQAQIQRVQHERKKRRPRHRPEEKVQDPPQGDPQNRGHDEREDAGIESRRVRHRPIVTFRAPRGFGKVTSTAAGSREQDKPHDRHEG